MLSFKKQLSFYKAGFPKNYRHLLTRRKAKLKLFFGPRVKIIGVVGSYGKTTTAQVIYKMLQLDSPTLSTHLSLDTIYNLPLTILKLKAKHHYLVLEMGIDHRREMDFHLSLATPDILIFTGITAVHAEKELLGSFSGIKEEKGKAVDAVIKKGGWVIANADDRHVRQTMKERGVEKIIWYGIKSNLALVRAEDIKIDHKGTSFKIITSQHSLKIKGRFWGEGWIAAFLAAASLSEVLKTPIKNLAKAAQKIRALPGRLSLEKGPRGSLLLDDHLRSNPASLSLGLKTLGSLKVNKGGRKIVILGEMGELGKYAKVEHQKIGQLLASYQFDQVIGIGSLLKETAKKTDLVWAKDILEAAGILEKLKPNSADIIYLKGSLLKHMERLLLYFQGKKIGCRVLSCHLYHPCPECPYLKTGYSRSNIGN
ncbi:MAG: Mur ligase family protein [Candidatus Shapirobacteria bacterium]